MHQYYKNNNSIDFSQNKRDKIAMIHYTHKCNIFLKYIIKCINQHQQYPTPKDIKIKNITIIDIANAIIISIRTPEVEKTV